MELYEINRTLNHKSKKAFQAVFKKENGKFKKVRFGSESNYVLNPSKTDADKKAYLARHKVRENWNDPTSAGALSRFLLWGESRKLKKNIKLFKHRFQI